jgi:RNase P/RNase MRP subunit POP5
LKTLRRRYLAVAIDSHDTVDSREFMDATWDAVTKLFGEYGASQAGLSLIDYDETKKLVVLRTWNKTLEMVRTALASTTHMGGKPVALHVLAVSGTIKALCKRLEEKRVLG